VQFSEFTKEENMARKATTPDSSGYIILLVDDSSEYLEATRSLLEGEGHTVLTAENGPTALDILKSRKVNLLLLDYYMPGMTGEEVVLKLRRADPLLQIILQTGYAGEQPPHELVYRLDMQGYHDKSDGPEKLLALVEASLKGKLE
jgi:two-component system, cell cycle response regulator